jgi:hypothetical protein
MNRIKLPLAVNCHQCTITYWFCQWKAKANNKIKPLLTKSSALFLCICSCSTSVDELHTFKVSEITQLQPKSKPTHCIGTNFLRRIKNRCALHIILLFNSNCQAPSSEGPALQKNNIGKWLVSRGGFFVQLAPLLLENKTLFATFIHQLHTPLSTSLILTPDTLTLSCVMI